MFISLNQTSDLTEGGMNICPPMTAVESNIYIFVNISLESSMFSFMHTQSFSPENRISPLRLYKCLSFLL